MQAIGSTIFMKGKFEMITGADFFGFTPALLKVFL